MAVVLGLGAVVSPELLTQTRAWCPVLCRSAGHAPAGPEGLQELSKAQGGAVVPGCSYKKPHNCLPSW